MRLRKLAVTVASALTAATMMLTTMPATQVSAATIKNDQSKVAMYTREFHDTGSYGYHYKDYIRVAKSISYGKVYLNYKNDQGVWEKDDTKFLTSLDDKYNIYVVDNQRADWHSETYVSCEANGNTYIDDNNGKNYTTENLGVSPLRVLQDNNYYGYASKYNVLVNLKNLAYQKDVKVRYTLDNWKTFKDAPLSYSMTYTDGTELWGTQIDTNGADKDGFHFAVSYTVNGQTYWDNNFGQNYGA